jgi:hypothetical protein
MRNLLFFFALIVGCSSPRTTPPQVDLPSGSAIVGSNPIPVPSATPGIYMRFYQGYPVGKLKSAELAKRLNAKFFPLFEKAHSQGLTSYRPALLKNSKVCALPAEVALLTFANEKTYKKYHDSKIGKRIQAAHRPVFRSDKSKSLVVESLTSTVLFDHAYVLNSGASDYSSFHGMLVVHCDPILKGDDLRIGLVKAYAVGTDATDIVFTASEETVLEYVFYPKEEELNARVEERNQRFAGLFKNTFVIPLLRMKIGKKKIKAGEGFDARWEKTKSKKDR